MGCCISDTAQKAQAAGQESRPRSHSPDELPRLLARPRPAARGEGPGPAKPEPQAQGKPEPRQHQGSPPVGAQDLLGTVHLYCESCGEVFEVLVGEADTCCPSCSGTWATPAQRSPVAMPLRLHEQALGLRTAPAVGLFGPQPTGRKRALLIGINYFGTPAELRGCINDVHRMRQVLQRVYGFPASPDELLMLTDDQVDPDLKPCRASIMRALTWLVDGVKPGDALFLHYSGHGAQQLDPTFAEEDGYDETICPCDFQSEGMIVDTELFDTVVAPLPPGAKLTAVMDCCHSGTTLDLPLAWRVPTGWAEEANPCHSAGDVVLLSGCQDDQTSADGAGSYAKPMGAMTTAFCNTVEKSHRRGSTHEQLTYQRLLETVRGELKTAGFTQVPRMTASQQFDAIGKLFSPGEGMEGNRNEHVGRQFPKDKCPQQPRLLAGGLGKMLAACAAGSTA